MKITEKDNYILITSDDKSLDDFIIKFKQKYTDVKESNVIIQFSEKLDWKSEEILLFLSYSDKFQQNGASFVVIISDVDIDSFPENFNIVPTLQEAEDIIEMEEIQRDLGF